MELKLKILGGRNDGTLIEVPGLQFLIGRADECQLRPKSETVSRRHALLSREDSKATIQDLGSRTGTFVNGKLAAAKTVVELKNDDVIRIGPIEFAIVISHGLARQKNPKVTSLEQAAARTAQGPVDEVDVTQWLKADDDVDLSLGETMDGSTGTVISASDLMAPAAGDAANATKAPPESGGAPDQAASDMLKNYLRRR